MSSKLSNLNLKARKRPRETDPEKIFNAVTLRGGVENIWSPQIEALRDWNAERARPRIILEMNTGGGKTLIALLIAQSIVNETKGSVLYVCPTNQLIEQTRFQASQISMETAAYFEGSWKDEQVFREGRGPCITNYAALFNGKSIFRHDPPAAILFDDAHVAGPSIRNAFTIRIDDKDEELFLQIVELFRPYLESSGHQQELAALLKNDPLPLLFIPGFELNRQAQKLSALLTSSGIDENKKTLFAWAHLRDHVDRCCVLISASRIEIGPVVPPTTSLSQISGCQRMVYMTATLPSAAQFARTFGPTEAYVIRPGGKSGAAQRLFVIARGETDEEQREWVKELLEDQKACILSASSRTAQLWSDCAEVHDGSQATLEAFKKAHAPNKLVMAARYDGIDLPGHSCRVLVIDGLPLGSFLLDRFADEVLHLEGLRTSSTAIRVTQAIGRIFRSNTDHGVVILCGKELSSWASTPKNQSYLPELLQRQIQLGFQLSESIDEDETTTEALIEGVLEGDKEWDRIYRDSIGDYDIEDHPNPPDWLVTAAGREHEAFSFFWRGDYQGASRVLANAADEVEEHDAGLAGWYRHWLGLAQERLGQHAAAARGYIGAANARAQLGRPTISSKTVLTGSAVTAGPQAERIGAQAQKMSSALKMLEKIKADLVYGENTKPAEAALKDLGTLLGLSASRPDNDERPKTGPDVLWRHTESLAGIALEMKTDKKPASQYQKKDDIGQFHDHVRYLSKKYSKETFIKAIVGRVLTVSSECNPPADLRIIGLEGFQDLASRVRQLYEWIESSSDSDALSTKAQRWLGHLGLSWPECVEALPFSLAVDLQRTETTADLVR